MLIYIRLDKMKTDKSVMPLDIELRFHPSEKYPMSDKNFNLIKDPPIYYSRDNIYNYFGKDYYSITYYIYYKENGAIGLGGIIPKNKDLGYHDKDIERLRILYDMKNKNPLFVFYSAHAQEGKWLKFNECETKNSNKTLVVYPSLSSHANRPKAGTYYRILGIANDYTSNKGKHVTPKLVNDDSMSYTIDNKEVLDTTWKALTMPFQNIKKLKEEQFKPEL